MQNDAIRYFRTLLFLFLFMILEHVRITHEITTMKEKIKENKDKVKVNKTLPYLVANVIELLDVEGDDQEEDGANVDLDAQVCRNSISIYGSLFVSFLEKRKMRCCENIH